MKKFIFCLICATLFSMIGCNQSVADAKQVYCSTKNGIHYFVETDEITKTRSELRYVGVYTDHGEHTTWLFENWKGEYKYTFWQGGLGDMGKTKTPWKYVKDSPLANDILYVALKERGYL